MNSLSLLELKHASSSILPYLCFWSLGLRLELALWITLVLRLLNSG